MFHINACLFQSGVYPLSTRTTISPSYLFRNTAPRLTPNNVTSDTSRFLEQEAITNASRTLTFLSYCVRQCVKLLHKATEYCFIIIVINVLADFFRYALLNEQSCGTLFRILCYVMIPAWMHSVYRQLSLLWCHWLAAVRLDLESLKSLQPW